MRRSSAVKKDFDKNEMILKTRRLNARWLANELKNHAKWIDEREELRKTLIQEWLEAERCLCALYDAPCPDRGEA